MIQEQLIKKEKFTSIQSAQAGLTEIMKKAEQEGHFYRVLRNNEPIGVLLPNNLWDALLEDLEALNSASYIASIKEARASSKRISSEKVKKELSLS